MIRVIVELDHGGLGQRVERLAEVRIANISRLAAISDYYVRVFGKDGRWLSGRDGLVRGHARNSKPVLTLVRRALEEAGY